MRPPVPPDRATAAWALLWLAAVALAIHRMMAYDVWWQLAAGAWIREHGFPSVDPFSYAFPGREWIELRWIWHVLLDALFRSFGPNALILLEVVLVLTALALAARAAGPRSGWAGVLGITVALACAQPRFQVRPEIASFVGLALVLLCVSRYKQGGGVRWIVGLPLAQAIWCNTHTLWVLGPVVLWVVVAAEALEALGARTIPSLFARTDRIAGPRLGWLAGVASASTLAVLATPYAWNGVVYGLRLFSQIQSGHVFAQAIDELQGPFSPASFGWNWTTIVYLLAIAVSALGFAMARSRVSLTRAALWGAFLFLSVRAQRNVALFGLVAGWTIAANLSEHARAVLPSHRALAARRLAAGALTALLAVVTPLAATDWLYRFQGSLKRFGFGVTDRRYPIRALAFAREERLPGPVLATLSDGGYVLFENGPASAYVDGRLEVYGPEILARVLPMLATGRGLDAEVERTGARIAVVPTDSDSRLLLDALARSPRWVPVYFDALHVVYLRLTEDTRALAERLAIDWARPPERRVAMPPALAARDWLEGLWPRAPDAFEDERLGALFAAVGSYDLALARFEAAVREDPGAARVRLYLGLFRRAQGRDAEADALLRGAPARWLELYEPWIVSAQLHLWTGRLDGAIAGFERAIALGAPEPETSIRLARAEIRAGRAGAAEPRLELIVADRPEAFDALNLLAVLAVKRGERARAIERFERSLAIEPNQADVCRTLARLHAEVGDAERAAELEARARAIDGAP